MLPERPLQDAIVRLLKRRPFYGQFLLQFRRRLQPGDRAAAVTIADAVPTLLVDPQRFALFAPLEQEALLEHLLKHVLHLHPCRRGKRHSRHWDLACDLAINPGIDNLPPAALQPSRFKLPENLTAEDYYARLPEVPLLGETPTAGGAGQQRHSAAEQLQQASTLDDHHPWQEADRTPVALAEQVVRQLVRDAVNKCHGETPPELQELLSVFLAPPVIPWQQILRQFVGNAGRVGRRSTWQRSHRRFGQNTPGCRKQQLLNLVVGVDVSDSTDTQPLREAFAGELLQIAAARQSRITVLYAGSRIQKIARFAGNPQCSEIYRGGGFTDLRPVFEHARQLQPQPTALIYLTDGFGPAPQQSAIPTLWVLSPDGKKPVDWGLELRLTRIEGRARNSHE